DLHALETELLAAVTNASDEPALEAVRVAALGRNGSISTLLKTLGTMSPEARKEQGAVINGLKDRVTAAIAERKEALKQSAADPRHHSWPHLPQRQRSDPHTHVPPGRGPRHRYELASRAFEMDSAGILQGLLRG